jgi:hypothetical protein
MTKNINLGFSNIRLLIVLLTFIPFTYSEFKSFYEYILYSDFFSVFVYSFFGGIFILVLIFDFNLFFKNKQIIAFTPSMIGVILMVLSFSIHKFHRYKLNQKTSLKAYSNWVDLKSTNFKYIIEFKANNSYVVYELEEEGMLTRFYYGSFIKKDSIYSLDSKFGKNKISNNFLVRSVKFKNKIEQQFIQIDENGNEIKSQFHFKIKPN